MFSQHLWLSSVHRCIRGNFDGQAAPAKLTPPSQKLEFKATSDDVDQALQYCSQLKEIYLAFVVKVNDSKLVI